MAVEVDALRQQLKRLRRDEGRTLLKLRDAQAVRAALGDPPEHELRQQFDAAVLALGSDLKSRALQNAYGIGMADPAILKIRRENFGALREVSRGPETVNNWEDEKLEELTAQLLSGALRQHDDHLMVAIAVSGGRIVVVAEGAVDPKKIMREMYNPSPEPSLPCYVYQIPDYSTPERLTMCAIFLEEAPQAVHSVAAGSLFAIVVGDERLALNIETGGLPELPAVAHAAVHWERPSQGVFFAVTWAY